MDDNTQRDGSDSDWDSTLDFTSPRQVGVGKPRVQYEVEDEESALSDESEFEGNLPNDNPVIKNVLRPQTENQDKHSPSPSGNVKENNIALAQKKQNGEQERTNPQQPANQYAQISDTAQMQPPYNFREALEADRVTPEPPRKEPPGKSRKGDTYDPAPSPTPRGISKNQSSIRSAGSWDESDADERTLKELRANYKEQKQREEQKQKEIEEQRSVAEDAPQTARSETTWRSWTGKFGKKSKSKNNQSQATEVKQPRQQQQQQQQQVPVIQQRQQQEQVVQQQHRYSLQSSHHQSSTSLSQIQANTRTPMTEIYDPSYDRVVEHHQQVQYLPEPRVQQKKPNYVMEEEFEDPKRLFVKDDDKGRYMYYFGHGNLRYYEVNEEFAEAVLPPVADKVDQIFRRVWQEIFSILRILLSFFINFLVEFFQFLAKHILQPLIVGVFVTMGDYVIKPLLSAIFNGFAQPFSIFMWNVFTGMRHMFGPIGEILHRVFEQVAIVLRSIRLCEVTWVSSRPEGPRPSVYATQNV